MNNLTRVSSAMVWGYIDEIADLLAEPPDRLACVRFILSQIKALPGWLKPAFVMLGWAMQLAGLLLGRGWFNRLEPQRRTKVLRLFERLPGPTRQFTRFHRVLTSFFCFEALGHEANK
jgi:hypothetical protein